MKRVIPPDADPLTCCPHCKRPLVRLVRIHGGRSYHPGCFTRVLASEIVRDAREKRKREREIARSRDEKKRKAP
jgi:hypothetical protein